MKSIEIIVHCYAEQHPHYAALLTAQLSSVLLSKPATCHVTVHVCTTDSDALTRRVVSLFSRRLRTNRDTGFRERIEIREALFPKERLFRRAVARNAVAKQTNATVVHFADADYLYGDGFLDGLVASPIGYDLFFPRRLLIQQDHATGDAEIAKIVPGQLYVPNWEQFVPWKTGIASGGLQFVRGEVARRGYLDGTRWDKPVNGSRFLDTTEDAAYRKSIENRGQVDVPGALYRMRHTASAFQTPEERLQKAKGGR